MQDLTKIKIMVVGLGYVKHIEKGLWSHNQLTADSAIPQSSGYESF